LINKISSSHTLGFSPFEKLYGYAPDYSSFRVFYCTCFVLYPHVEHSKLSAQSVICVFLSYGEGKKRYCCFNLVTQIPLLMFDKFVLIIMQVLTLYSPAHLKLYSHLQSPKLHLRLWIHIYVNSYVFISPQSYQILRILVIHHHLLPFLAFIHCLSKLSSYKKKKVFFYPLWQQTMNEELIALHKTDN